MAPLIFTVALSLLAADAGQTAPQGAAATQVASTASSKSTESDDDRVICKNQAITGSRFVKRLCMKKSEWSEMERRTEEFSRRLGENAGRNAANATGGGMTNGQ